MSSKFVQSDKSAECWSVYSSPTGPVKRSTSEPASEAMPSVGAGGTASAGATSTPISPANVSPAESVTVWVKRARPENPGEGVKRAVLPSGSSSTVPASLSGSAMATVREGAEA